jgi:protein-glutamine gamma-glutamyltransferase
LQAPPAPRLRAWRATSLPRDTRDTFFLLAVIAWTVLPHLLHLPPWCALLCIGVLAWRARLAWAGGALPGRWVLAGVLVLVLALTFWSYRSLLGKEPGVALVVSLMALKTLELRARRDAFVVFFLGFFLILTHFVFSQSLPVAGAMLVSVWGLLTALVLAHMPVGQPALRQAAGLAARTALLGAPVMVLLFVLFPRIGPLWGVPQDGLASTGLSNSLRMGSVAELAQSDTVALRLRFFGAVPAPVEQYFRGPVLSRFDGEEWQPVISSSLGERGALQAELQVEGAPLRYEMTVEPLKLRVLPLLEAAAQAPRFDGAPVAVAMRSDLQWLAEQRLFERVRLNATAHPRFRHGPTTREPGLQDHLRLPPGYNPRTLAWAAELRRRLPEADAKALADAVYAHIRANGYTYTLAPGVYGETNPRGAIDEFWLDRKEGFCEHFASSFVVVMRAMDVPARIVTGFQGMDELPVDGYYVVRNSAAHAWAEYWQAGQGWVRADPTAAVAPDRIRRSARLAPAPGLMGTAINAVSPALLLQLRNAWEGLNNRWNQWVLNYTRGQQLDLLKNLGFQSPSWEDLAILLVCALSALALGSAAWAWWDRHRISPWARQMQALRKALRRLGMPARDSDPPRTLAAQLREHSGAWRTIDRIQAEALARLLETLDQQRYSAAARSRPDAQLTQQFVSLARRLHLELRRSAAAR